MGNHTRVKKSSTTGHFRKIIFNCFPYNKSVYHLIGSLNALFLKVYTCVHVGSWSIHHQWKQWPAWKTTLTCFYFRLHLHAKELEWRRFMLYMTLQVQRVAKKRRVVQSNPMTTIRGFSVQSKYQLIGKGYLDASSASNASHTNWLKKYSTLCHKC